MLKKMKKKIVKNKKIKILKNKQTNKQKKKRSGDIVDRYLSVKFGINPLDGFQENDVYGRTADIQVMPASNSDVQLHKAELKSGQFFNLKVCLKLSNLENLPCKLHFIWLRSRNFC